MKTYKLFAVAALLVLAVMMLAACGGGSQPATLNDVPTYPNTTELKQGQNPMADTLAQNVATAAGMGQKLDQKMYKLPKDAKWDDVKGFYSGKLTGAGWQAINVPSVPNPTFQMSIFKRGTQSLTVAQLNDPSTNDSFLLFSLAN